jgi:hypothetical protein
MSPDPRGGVPHAAFVSFSSSLFCRLGWMFFDVLLDELDQNVSHLFAFCGSGSFEGIMQAGLDIQVHALPPWLFGHSAHLRETEMSLYVYE